MPQYFLTHYTRAFQSRPSLLTPLAEVEQATFAGSSDIDASNVNVCNAKAASVSSRIQAPSGVRTGPAIPQAVAKSTQNTAGPNAYSSHAHVAPSLAGIIPLVTCRPLNDALKSKGLGDPQDFKSISRPNLRKWSFRSRSKASMCQSSGVTTPSSSGSSAPDSSASSVTAASSQSFLESFSTSVADFDLRFGNRYKTFDLPPGAQPWRDMENRAYEAEPAAMLARHSNPGPPDDGHDEEEYRFSKVHNPFEYQEGDSATAKMTSSIRNKVRKTKRRFAFLK